MTRVWVNGAEIVDENNLPSIPEMIQIVQLYIYKVTGRAIKPIIFGTNEIKLSRELHLLEFMYKRAIENIQYV